MFQTIITTIQMLFTLVTKSIPSDEERLKRLEAKYPAVVEKAKTTKLNQKIVQVKKVKRFIKFAKKNGIDTTELEKDLKDLTQDII